MPNLLLLVVGLVIVLGLSSASAAQKKRENELDDSPSGTSFVWGLVMFVAVMLLAFH